MITSSVILDLVLIAIVAVCVFFGARRGLFRTLADLAEHDADFGDEQRREEGKEEEPVKPKKLFNIDAYIPKEYANQSDKLELYQELEKIKDEKSLARFGKKLRDIYGRLPDEVSLLLLKARVDILASSEEFLSVKEEGSTIYVTLSDRFSRISGIGTELFNALAPHLNYLSVSFVDKKLVIRVYKKGKTDLEWIQLLEKVVTIIGKVYRSRVN